MNTNRHRYYPTDIRAPQSLPGINHLCWQTPSPPSPPPDFSNICRGRSNYLQPIQWLPEIFSIKAVEFKLALRLLQDRLKHSLLASCDALVGSTGHLINQNIVVPVFYVRAACTPFSVKINVTGDLTLYVFVPQSALRIKPRTNNVNTTAFSQKWRSSSQFFLDSYLDFPPPNWLPASSNLSLSSLSSLVFLCVTFFFSDLIFPLNFEFCFLKSLSLSSSFPVLLLLLLLLLGRPPWPYSILIIGWRNYILQKRL